MTYQPQRQMSIRDGHPQSPTSSGHGDIDIEVHEKYMAQRRGSGIVHPPMQGASQSSEVSATSSSAPSPDSRISRLLGVSDILNPTPRAQSNTLPPLSTKRNVDDAHFETPQRISVTPQKAPLTKSLPPSPVEQNDSAERLPMHGTFPRHMKHPVAPSSRMGQQRPGIPPPQSYNGPVPPPPLTSPMQGSYHENLPSPSMAPHRPSGSYPFPPSHPSNPRPGNSSISPNIGSPSTAYNSSFAHPGHPQHSHPLTTPPLSAYGQTSPRFSMSEQGQSYSEPSSATTPTLPHHHFPIMHLSTAEGHIAIPIDTTAASKIADEKRRRNAGASARFRQRRKEREREMSTRISELELKLKVVEQERDHYRNLALKYAGTPLPNTAGVDTNGQRTTNHGLQLSPRLMSIANSQPLSTLPPFTTPAYGNGRPEPQMSPDGSMARSRSSEASVNGHANGIHGLGVRGMGSLESLRDVKREGDDRGMDSSDMSRRSSIAGEAERSYTHTRERTYPDAHYYNGISDWQHRAIERH